MSAPIPEPNPLDRQPLVRGPRPDWLIVLCAFEAAVTLAMLTQNHGLNEILYSAFWLAVVYCLWCGRNWARIVVIISGVITLLSFTSLLEKSSMLALVINVVNLSTSIGWLIMLSRREAVAFTRGLPPSSPGGWTV